MIRLFASAMATLFLTIAPAAAAERTVTLGVENMTCATCPYIVKETLAAVPGVTEVEVSAEDNTASVTFEDTQTDVPALTAATAASGYPSRLAENTGQ